MSFKEGDLELDQGGPAASTELTGAHGNETTTRISSESKSQQGLRSDGSEIGTSREVTPPPLPPRPEEVGLQIPASGAGSLRLSKQTARPQLLSQPTTALSLADVNTKSRQDSNSVQSSPVSRAASRKHSFSHLGHLRSDSKSEEGESSSPKSYVPTLDTRIDNSSIPDNADTENSAAMEASDFAAGTKELPPLVLHGDETLESQMHIELDNQPSPAQISEDEDVALQAWKDKLKHFLILSASGKPIYSRHGDDGLTSHYIGVVQTLMSFYQTSKDPLRAFTAGSTRFVILSKGPLSLVAISRLGESDAQLRTQLESLYMQILSTLTLPSMEKMFSNRPSTDLRRPLQGTDVLLDGLADGFTRGSPSTLLSALECLRLRKTDRKAINDTLLEVRSPNLLYGLIVAAGRLVSVIRPKRHSLHPGDLHLVFNMLFEAGSVKAGGGENWIPLCLPGFNNTGFLYMYVNFLSTSTAPPLVSDDERQSSAEKDAELAVVLISANREAFYELRQMCEELVSSLRKSANMRILDTAINKGRATCAEIIPNTVILHFLYKSRGNVQFTMPSFEPHFHRPVERRKLISLYGILHENIHLRTSHLKVQHIVSSDSTALAWETPLFELYCVAPPSASREALVRGANKVVQWVRREEERVFIIGGAVF